MGKGLISSWTVLVLIFVTKWYAQEDDLSKVDKP